MNHLLDASAIRIVPALPALAPSSRGAGLQAAVDGLDDRPAMLLDPATGAVTPAEWIEDVSAPGPLTFYEVRAMSARGTTGVE